MIYKSVITAIVVAAAVQSFTVGVLSPKLSLEICRPGAETSRSVSFSGAKSLSLKNSDGAVKVEVGTGDTLDITATIRAYVSDRDSQPIAEEYVKGLVVASETAGDVSVVTEPGQRPDALDLRVDYLVTVPEGTDLVIQGSNGNVWVGKGCDDVDIQGNNSDIELNEPTGSIRAKCANGRIRVLNAPKATEIETVNGSIYATVTGGEFKATTANGNILTTIARPDVKVCDLTAMNGGITLLLAENCSAEVEATTGRGDVRSELPVTAPTGTSKRRELRGRIGAGETQLNLNSLNGNISIARSDS